ncbi:cation:proton antiporter [Pseudomonas sp. B21-048]|uniref:cation:proton antiporter n=1 Tax=Pseudomonas sp. B21-048 TaxID=2895490 RepID=UPI00215DF3CD|nr:cation:proton antiporter [Pseudomonas sp. B21-048]UVK97980.1 cation:proton antiporter [Pseudomonas sp. B21-048]
MLFLQIVFIILTAKVAGACLKKLGQPEVVGEMIAGFVLGPLVLGFFFPGAHHALFQGDAVTQLKVLSDLGILLFMFVVGAEFRMPEQRTPFAQGKVLLVAGCAIALPFALGIAITPLLYSTFAPVGTPHLGFNLFIATVFSVTAFPVLARILKERQMLDSEVGALSLMAAAVSDVCAWVLLAITAMSLQLDRQWQDLALRLCGLVALCAASFWCVRPLLSRWIAHLEGTNTLTLLAVLLCGALIYGSITEWLQVHAVFGAFLFGACLPRDQRLLNMLVERVEHIAVIVLMPSFFALAGLNTTAATFSGVGVNLLGLVLLVAIIGKLLGGALGARFAGYSTPVAMRVGVLMNARGLMELVVLKIGLDLGIIGKELFTLFVIMTVVTTVMTGPLLNVLDRLRLARQRLDMQ